MTTEPQGAAGPGRAPSRTAAGSGRLARHNRRLAFLALAVMAVVWGYNWVVMKRALAFVGPIDFTALRGLLAAFVLLAIRVITRRPPVARRVWPRLILLGLLQTALFSGLVQMALLHGGAGKTSFLAYTMPFWVVAMAWPLFGERVKGLQWLALALAGSGLLLILAPWNGGGTLFSSLLAVGGGFSWALATIVAKWIQRDYVVDTLSLTAWQMLAGALVLCVVAWLVPERPLEPTPYFFGALFFNVFVATALAWFLWLFALRHLSSGVAGMASLAVPVIGGLSGWIELGEQPDGLELTGMGLIALALLVLSLAAMHPPRPPAVRR